MTGTVGIEDEAGDGTEVGATTGGDGIPGVIMGGTNVGEDGGLF